MTPRSPTAFGWPFAIAMAAIFATSYSLVLGRATPHHITIGLVGSPAPRPALLAALKRATHGGLAFRRYATDAAAEEAIDEQTTPLEASLEWAVKLEKDFIGREAIAESKQNGVSRITVGLREGWDAEGRVYDVSEAVRTARAWMSRRVGASLPALSGMFTRAEVTYAWPRPDGSAGSDREPVAVFTGEAVHAYLGHLPDQEIEAMLNELAVELGAALGQERLYVAFCDRTWILDAGEREG